MGFSSGHVGTTSFSDKNSYSPFGKSGELIDFIFEKGAVAKTHYMHNWTITQEINHVEKTYGHYVLDHANQTMFALGINDTMKNITIVDLSHSCLFYYRGLIYVAKNNSNKMSVEFIRLRRDRVETVISMTSDPKFFDHDYYRYHPLENVPSVVLSVKPEVWFRFKFLQQAFWVLDETEARWNKMLRFNPQMKYSEVLWASRWEDSMNTSMDIIADVIGTKRINVSTPHKNEHAKPKRKNEATLAMQAVELDRQYQVTMGYEYLPF